ncbi:uncharacterized protein [Eucyclogobius newberryi]|uniref:uncharacterized protein n=1 Tax=Eucyclogobius newberryi TaxID=166745 RepID=UPI003B5B5B84
MAAGAGLLSLVGFAWMTLYAAFWWDSFMWTLLFCLMHVMSLCWLDSHFEPYSKNSATVFCCGLATVFTFLGVFLFLLPGIGLDLFRILFNIGVIGALGSILFSCVEKTFDQQLHSAVDTAFATVKHKLTVGEMEVAVLLAFFIGLTSFLSLTPRRRPSQMCTNDELQQKEMEERLDKMKNAGMKLIIGLGFGTLIWKSGVLFWIIRGYFSDIIHFTAVFVLGAGCTITASKDRTKQFIHFILLICSSLKK